VGGPDRRGGRQRVTDGGRESTLQLRLLLDEDTPKQLAHELKAAGHDVVRSVDADELGDGADDEAIRSYAARNDRIVVTHDGDHAIAARTDGLPPRVFRLKEQRHPPHIQALLIAKAVKYADAVSDLPPVLDIGDEYL
jgi:predicted nuclease of predicted toxin-antitoxin system